MCKTLCRDMFSFVLNIYLVAELLNRVSLCLIVCRSVRLFPKATAPFYNPVISVRGFQSFHILANTSYRSFYTKATLVGMEQYFTMVLICISLTANEVEHLSMCFWP